MPIYEYYCSDCDTEYELIRSVAQADEPALCQVCGQPGQRQLSTFSFKSDTFTSPRLKRSNQRPLRPHNRSESPQTPEEDAAR